MSTRSHDCGNPCCMVSMCARLHDCSNPCCMVSMCARLHDCGNPCCMVSMCARLHDCGSPCCMVSMCTRLHDCGNPCCMVSMCIVYGSNPLSAASVSISYTFCFVNDTPLFRATEQFHHAVPVLLIGRDRLASQYMKRHWAVPSCSACTFDWTWSSCQSVHEAPLKPNMLLYQIDGVLKKIWDCSGYIRVD